MRFDVNYKIVNEEFDKEYAEQYNWGEPGPGNMKYHETTKYRIENVSQFSQIENAKLEVKGVDEDGAEHTFGIEDLYHLKCELEDGTSEDFYVSNSLIRNIHSTKDKYNNGRFYFYLNGKSSYTRISETCFVSEESISDETKKIKWESLALPNEVKSKLIEKSGSFIPKYNPNDNN